MCLRCRSSGVVCDGYLVEAKSKADIENPTSNGKETQATHICAPIIPQNPRLTIPGNVEEVRSFDFFRCRTAPCLAKALGWSSLERLVLQISHFDIALRHATLALGSLFERLHVNYLLTSTNDLANARHDFALLQYNKALNQLRKDIESDTGRSLETTLLTCLLFILVEFLQGNDVATLIHLRSGLDILRRSYPEGRSATNRPPTFSSDHENFHHVIMRVFAYLDMSATRWLGVSSFLTEDWNPIDSFEFRSIKAESFSNIEEAEESLWRQRNQLHDFQHSVAIHNTWKLLDQGQLTASAEREKLEARLYKWPSAIGVLLEQQGTTLSPEDLRRVTLLRIKHKVTTIMLAASLEVSKKATYRRFDPVFEQIVSFATSLLRPFNVIFSNNVGDIHPMNGAHGSLPFLQIGITEGVIQALYFTAISCCNRRISRKALSLLSAEPWREGAWDSIAMARIAERKVCELEKEGWYEA